MRNPLYFVLAAVAMFAFVMAILSGALDQPSNAANWAGLSFLSIGLLTLRACLIDIRKGA